MIFWDCTHLALLERTKVDGGAAGTVVFAEILTTPAGQSKGCG
jgi:hypothetical protein